LAVISVSALKETKMAKKQNKGVLKGKKEAKGIAIKTTNPRVESMKKNYTQTT